MGIANVFRVASSAGEDERFQELYQAILQGTAEAPRWYEDDGLAFARWKSRNRRVTDRMERIHRAEQGIAPVAFEETFQAAGRRGYAACGGGYARAVGEVRRYQTATSLNAGFQPNVVGAPAPMIGAPLGRHVVTGVDVGFDALSWFAEGIISNPSTFVMSLPGLGKSTFIRKILMSHVAQGHVPIVAGDIKKEYVGFAQQVGGQVITLAPGKGKINPLDAGALGGIIPVLEANRDALAAAGHGEVIAEVKDKVRHRQVTMVASLLSLGRSGPVKDYETTLISCALREMYDDPASQWDWANPPLVSDLIQHLDRGSDQLRWIARARSEEEWFARVDELILSLNSLLDGATGQIFDGHTTDPISVDSTAVVMDVSSVDRGDAAMKAAVILSAWSAAFGAVEAAHTLADVGLRRQKYFALTLDEMWQTLGAAPGLVARVDEISRLNRTDATALYEITHTSEDLEALPTEEDRKKARGFIARAGAVVCGGLPMEEINLLQTTLRFTAAEADRVVSWSRGATPKRSRNGGYKAPPPGRGRFMIKPSKDGAPGIPLQTVLHATEVELDLHNTNKRFDDLYAVASQAIPAAAAAVGASGAGGGV